MNLSLEEKRKLLWLDQERRARAAQKSLLAFTTFTKGDYQINWHHRAICDAIARMESGEIRRLLVFMPPRHGKSELISRRLPPYLLGRNPDLNIIGCSYGASLASLINRDVQKIMDEPAYQKLFPNTRLNSKNIRTVASGNWLRNSDMFEVVGTRGRYRSAGIGGGITGMGADWAIVDDPIKNQEEANSRVFRDRTWDWWTSTLFTRLEKNARVVVTLTRWHEDDLGGRLLEQGGWTVLCLPAIKEGPPTADDPREEGQALWPGKYDEAAMEEIKRVSGSKVWGSVYQQHPTPADGTVFRREWFQNFWRELPADMELELQTWDLTFSDGEKNDYVAGFLLGRKGARRYIIDRVWARMDFNAQLGSIRSFTAKHPRATLKLIEKAANGAAAIATLEREIPGIVPIVPKGSKIGRAEATTPEWEAGNVVLPHPDIAPWVHDFIEEHVAFPNGKHDDQVDAVAQGLMRLRESNTLDWTPVSLHSSSKWR